MPNNCLSVLYKRIIQVENKNMGLKVGGHKHTIGPPIKNLGGGAHAPLAPPLPTPVYYYTPFFPRDILRLRKSTPVPIVTEKQDLFH